ncbi:MAG: class I SAM-dependent methyltransferase [Hyphomonadaceae bacterium]|nr:class I SAM-dependent methyltransferase [Hyphomonadaceae bacterium]
MIRARLSSSLFAALLALAPAAIAQETPADIPALRKAALADPAVKAALDDRSRGMESRLEDDGRMAEIILKAIDAKPGETAIDIGSGSGYLALLVSSMVGPKGHVDIHNTPGWINQFPTMEPERQQLRIKQPNIGWVTTRWTDITGQPNSYDIVVMGQIYHDIPLEGESIDAVNERLFAMLKPGGRVIIEDHDAIETMPLSQQVSLHRISHGDVTGQMLRAGFALKIMTLLDSPHDDRRFNVFRPGVKGRTDRYIAVFEKPADGKPLR